ncbi:hypothetical protein K432DRAFT_382838 [Lepidopterella palustris CBS 459.81]|uniref:Phosphatidate phosphatase APP1 catalytic domain-containing protein n=1 Tax=Lepidopterella palustris CBS 459.81 TaxID=1314670 RepID=A0A8E2E9B8_9PEZI|nr:hypothetical protein K432DRAFT_382838 [Lepidopterella palustris CBS 459.81]
MAGQTRQHMQENDESRETRTLREFADLESTMPSLSSRWNCSIKDNLTSHLGSKNPFYSFVHPDNHIVWLLDNTAWQPEDGKGAWKAEFVAAYFLKNSGHDTSKVVAYISEKIGLAKGDKAEVTIGKRVQPFLDSVLPAHAINIDGGKMGALKLGPSGRDGISSNELMLPGDDYTDGQSLQAIGIDANATPLTTTFAKPTGWAVISDIDDTIKRTLTLSAIGILKTTFVDKPEPIEGMPELYKHITEKLKGPPFWYLSASPYNLYPFLHEFRSTYYPHGTIVLRDASWMNLAGLLTNLTQGTQAYKTDRMDKIHRWFPRRKFLCIGDSTQTDPESYGEMFRRYPGWVCAIFIRKVTDIAEMDVSKNNSPERFEKAFKDVPQDVWHVFEDPSELYEKVAALEV